MPTANLLIVLLVLGAIAYYTARSRSVAMAQPLGGVRHLHSLPFFYGMRAAIWCALPAVLLLVIWAMFDEPLISAALISSLPEQLKPHTAAEHNLLLNSIENIASGALRTENADPNLVAAAKKLHDLRDTGQYLMTAAVLSLSVIGLGWGWVKVSPKLRARQEVERVFKGVLIACACVAIFTTVGILLSVLFESQSSPAQIFLQ